MPLVNAVQHKQQLAGRTMGCKDPNWPQSTDSQQQLLPAVAHFHHSLQSLSGVSGRSAGQETARARSAVLNNWFQVWVLMARFYRSWLRTPVMAVAEGAQYIIMALFLGLLYLHSPLAVPNAPFDRASAISVVLLMLSLTPSYTVLVTWDHERLLLRWETSTNMYTRCGLLLQYVVSSLTTEVWVHSAGHTLMRQGLRRDAAGAAQATNYGWCAPTVLVHKRITAKTSRCMPVSDPNRWC